MSILICDPDKIWAEKVRKYFTQLNCVAEVSENGKECQLKVYKKKFECIILDIDTVNHSGLEVLKFLRLSYPGIRVILTVAKAQRLSEMQIGPETLMKLGISKVLTKPYSMEKIVETVGEQNHHTSWKDLIENDTLDEVEEVTHADSEFTRIDLNTINLENAAIFDCFTRVGKNKFLKLFSRGDIFSQKRIDKYFPDKSARYVYFKTKDRSIYINFMNDLIFKLADNGSVGTSQKVDFAKSLTEKYIEEVHTKGLHLQLVEEGKKVCENMFEIIQNNKDASLMMKGYEDTKDGDMAHTFMTCFFSVMIAKKLDWKSARTIEAIGLGGLLHDIGKLKLDRRIRDKDVSSLSKAELAQYQRHPEFGVDLLQKCEGISEAVVQVVYQHHELMSGRGFPNKLSGSKIYPLARVVCLADAFSHDMIKKKLSPLNTLKELIADKSRVFDFDPKIVKALISCFIATTDDK